MLTPILLAVHVFICLAIVGLVLLQHGKGADAGAAFGSGASGTVFGSRGSASFLTRATGLLAAGFFATSLVLAMLAGTYASGGSVVDGTGTLIERDDGGDEASGAAEEKADNGGTADGPPAPAGSDGAGAAPAPAPAPSGSDES